jgi:hypothetical protein
MKRPGRVKCRLARLLASRLGVAVDPSEMWQNACAERLGVARWGVWVVLEGRNVSVHSWDTMTECLQHGFEYTTDSSGGSIEISARD